MTSDPALLLHRIRRLSQALLISGALNIGVLSLLLYWALRERPPTPYCELKPASQEQQQIPLADRRKCTEAIAELSQFSFPELVNRLSNTQMIEDGYAERDLALTCLTAFHHFDIYRALPKNGQSLQKRYFAWQPKAQEASIPLIIYPNLQQVQFDAIIQFAKTERWPFTSQGLFLLLQEQKKANALNDHVIESFVLTPEFWTVELLFNRSGQNLSKQEILAVLLEGNWILLKQFIDQQRQLQDTSEARRQKFLLDYLKERSATAALLLLKNEWDFAVKKLDDQQAIAILELMPSELAESERYAIEMLVSPRSMSVWKKASERLYAKEGESFPEQWEYQTVVARFASDKKEVLPLANTIPPVKQMPTVLKVPTQTKKEKIPLKQATGTQSPQKPSVKPPKALVPTKTKNEVAEAKPAKGQKTPPKPRTYVVQEGDSLWKIARRFGVKIEDIRTLNAIQSDTLQPGMTLKIPSSKEKKA